MAPKKTAKPTTTPLRRSARVASREPSAEPPAEITKPAVIVGLATQNNDLLGRYHELKHENDVLGAEKKELEEKGRDRSSLRRAEFMRKISEYPVPAQISAPAAEENRPASPVAAATAEVASSAPLGTPAQSPPQEFGPASTPQSSTAVPAASAAAEIAPARRLGMSPWKSIVAGLTGYIPGIRKRRAEGEAAVEEPAAKRTRVDEAEITPISRPSPQKHLMRSVKNPAEPSSLSTITEYTEASSIMDAAPDTTPSKMRSPPSALPRHLLQSTPVPPKRRTLADVRAKLAEKQANKPIQRYSWEKQAAMQKPREKNADTRLAKMQEFRDAERKRKEAEADIERLKNDAELKDVLAHSVHRRKRVKIDHLAVIPHNRPGDSSSTFRMPEEDSDSEISVDEDVEESSNVFEATEKAKAKVVQEKPETTTVTIPAAVTPPVHTEPTFLFPSVATKPGGYYVSEEFKEQAGIEFAKGLAEFISA